MTGYAHAERSIIAPSHRHPVGGGRISWFTIGQVQHPRHRGRVRGGGLFAATVLFGSAMVLFGNRGFHTHFLAGNSFHHINHFSADVYIRNTDSFRRKSERVNTWFFIRYFLLFFFLRGSVNYKSNDSDLACDELKMIIIGALCSVYK